MINHHDLTIDHFHRAPLFEGRASDKLRKFHLCAAWDHSTVQGMNLEFGVFNGYTLNALARKIAPEKVYGFDSFEGLPEYWAMRDDQGLAQGYFAVDHLPPVESNTELVVGWFNETLPGFLQQHPEPVRFLHLDADLYSSTVYVLRELNDRIQPGTTIVFDELFAWHNPTLYTNWHQGEFAALQDWMREYDREIEVLYRTDYFQASIQVRK
jgi:hypothetical protein